MRGTLFIVPALTDQAGQCRIVGSPGIFQSASHNYQANPSAWQEVGLMNSRGELVCLNKRYSAAGGWAELKDSEPLMAGCQFTVMLAEDSA